MTVQPAFIASRSRSFLNLLVLLSLVALSVVGCKKTPEDVREWEKAKGSEDKMKEFILGDNDIDVKVEATEILVERGAAANLMAIFKDVDESEKEAIIDGVIPHIEDLLAGDNQHFQLQAKDGAYYILQTGATEEQRTKLLAVLYTWISTNDNFYRPSEVAGKVDKHLLFEALGSQGLPVLQAVLEENFDLLDEAKTDDRKLELMRIIQGVVALAEELNLKETDEMLAGLFVKKIEQYYPEIPEVYGIPFLKNKSDKLKPIAKKIVLDKNYQGAQLSGVRDLVINEYYQKVQPKEGVTVCAQAVAEDVGGFARWQCALTLFEIAKDSAIDHVFLRMPNDPKIVPIPDDHYIVELGMVATLETYWWDEVDSFCRSSYAMHDGNPPVDKFRGYLGSDRLVEKMMALRCLSWLGEPGDVDKMRALSEDITDITAWGYPAVQVGEDGQPKPTTTLGQLATISADDWKDQSKSLKQ